MAKKTPEERQKERAERREERKENKEAAKEKRDKFKKKAQEKIDEMKAKAQEKVGELFGIATSIQGEYPAKQEGNYYTTSGALVGVAKKIATLPYNEIPEKIQEIKDNPAALKQFAAPAKKYMEILLRSCGLYEDYKYAEEIYVLGVTIVKKIVKIVGLFVNVAFAGEIAMDILTFIKNFIVQFGKNVINSYKNWIFKYPVPLGAISQKWLDFINNELIQNILNDLNVNPLAYDIEEVGVVIPEDEQTEAEATTNAVGADIAGDTAIEVSEAEAGGATGEDLADMVRTLALGGLTGYTDGNTYIENQNLRLDALGRAASLVMDSIVNSLRNDVDVAFDEAKAEARAEILAYLRAQGLDDAQIAESQAFINGIIDARFNGEQLQILAALQEAYGNVDISKTIGDLLLALDNHLGEAAAGLYEAIMEFLNSDPAPTADQVLAFILSYLNDLDIAGLLTGALMEYIQNSISELYRIMGETYADTSGFLQAMSLFTKTSQLLLNCFKGMHAEDIPNPFLSNTNGLHGTPLSPTYSQFALTNDQINAFRIAYMDRVNNVLKSITLTDALTTYFADNPSDTLQQIRVYIRDLIQGSSVTLIDPYVTTLRELICAEYTKMKQSLYEAYSSMLRVIQPTLVYAVGEDNPASYTGVSFYCPTEKTTKRFFGFGNDTSLLNLTDEQKAAAQSSLQELFDSYKHDMRTVLNGVINGTTAGCQECISCTTLQGKIIERIHAHYVQYKNAFITQLYYTISSATWTTGTEGERDALLNALTATIHNYIIHPPDLQYIMHIEFMLMQDTFHEQVKSAFTPEPADNAPIVEIPAGEISQDLLDSITAGSS